MTKIRNPLSIENVLSSMISKLDEDEVKINLFHILGNVVTLMIKITIYI